MRANRREWRKWARKNKGVGAMWAEAIMRNPVMFDEFLGERLEGPNLIHRLLEKDDQ